MNDSSGSKRKYLWRISLYAVLLGGVFLQLAHTMADPDLWGHVRFGQDIWEAGGVAQVDPYAYTSGGQRWINHEWLSEAIFALFFDAFGAGGLVALKVLLWGATIAGVYAFLVRRGMRHLLAGVLVLFATFFAFGVGTIAVRPHIFTFPLFLATLLLIRRAEAGSLRWLWLAPPLFALWVNLHGGVLAGLGVFGAWTVAHLVWHRGRSWQQVGLPFLVSVGALLLNPYGAALPLFLLRTGTVPRPEIVEWAPVDLTGVLGFGYLTLLGIGVAALLFSRRPRHPRLLMLFVIIALTPLLAVRLLPLFAIGVLILNAEHIADAWERLVARLSEPGPAKRRTPPIWASAGALAAAVVLLVPALQGASCITLERDASYPVGAVEFLRASGVEGNVAIPFNWGEYALWHLSPAIRVSMDGRRETVYSDSVYRSARDFELGRGDWDRVLTEYPTDMVLVNRNSPTANLLELHADWQRAYADPLAVVYTRPEFAGHRTLTETPAPELPHDGTGMCFP